MPESPELRLAVLGSPISHSKSPKLHAAAYRALGLDWGYEAIELDAAQLGDFVAGLDASWRGLSLTMPHKHVVLSLLDERDPLVDLVGAANTLLLDDGARRGFNTDVEGIVRAFADHGVTALDTVEILGAGATAQSALAAAAQLGARAARVVVRNLARAESLIPLAERLGVELTRERFGDPRGSLSPDAVISTLPGGTSIVREFPAELRGSAVLFDVAYDPWPSALAASWQQASGRVVSGLEMLVHQAVAQVRIFVSGSADVALSREDEVRDAMRSVVGLGT
ncbi:MAG: shikimate dehydrogenase [Leifsonia sp.]|nr:shikimate dehydrogenase [Leifsonia sp.]